MRIIARAEQGRELAEAQQLVQLFSAATIYLIHLRRKKRKFFNLLALIYVFSYETQKLKNFFTSST